MVASVCSSDGSTHNISLHGLWQLLWVQDQGSLTVVAGQGMADLLDMSWLRSLVADTLATGSSERMAPMVSNPHSFCPHHQHA